MRKLGILTSAAVAGTVLTAVAAGVAPAASAVTPNRSVVYTQTFMGPAAGIACVSVGNTLLSQGEFASFTCLATPPLGVTLFGFSS